MQSVMCRVQMSLGYSTDNPQAGHLQADLLPDLRKKRTVSSFALAVIEMGSRSLRCSSSGLQNDQGHYKARTGETLALIGTSIRRHG